MDTTATPRYEYMLASFVSPLSKVGGTFREWPLHITLVPWFEAPSEQVLVAAIRRTVQTKAVFTVRGIRRSMFGWGKALPVTVMEPALLKELHTALIDALLVQRIHIKNPTHTGHAYVPHVTKKGGHELAPGDQAVIDHVAIIKAPCQDARGRTKAVVAWIGLQRHE